LTERSLVRAHLKGTTVHLVTAAGRVSFRPLSQPIMARARPGTRAGHLTRFHTAS
jgi:hypothetical protein